MRLIKGELPQEIVKGHHDNKACDNAEGGQSGPALGMVSGIISSLITKSMAPAAKASPSGNMGWKTGAERLSIALAELAAQST